MTAAEVRRAMRVLPLYLAAVVLAPIARIAVAAIQKEIALWLAVVLALGLAVWPAVVSVRLRRRYWARLDQLRDPVTGSLPAAGVAAPIPLALWVWLIAVPVLVALALFLAVRAPGAGDTCVARGIATAAGREGVCERRANLFGGGVTFNVVDAGHVLQMPGYNLQLLATHVAPTRVTNPQPDPRAYPDGHGQLCPSRSPSRTRRARPCSSTSKVVTSTS